MDGEEKKKSERATKVLSWTELGSAAYVQRDRQTDRHSDTRMKGENQEICSFFGPGGVKAAWVAARGCLFTVCLSRLSVWLFACLSLPYIYSAFSISLSVCMAVSVYRPFGVCLRHALCSLCLCAMRYVTDVGSVCVCLARYSLISSSLLTRLCMYVDLTSV